MSAKLFLYVLTVCPAFDLIDAGSLHNNNSVPVTHRTYNKVAGVKSISKRQVSACRQFTQYWFNGTCCNSCEPGSFAKTIGCTKDNPRTLCESCKVGKEYMDHYNHHTQCLRCRTCDTEHGIFATGMEVESPCITTQNVKCRCMPSFFCTSTKPCDHCNPCDKCENGIVKDCSQTENTKCKGNFQNLSFYSKRYLKQCKSWIWTYRRSSSYNCSTKTDNSLLSWLIPTIVLIVMLLIIVVVVICFRKKQKNTENQTGNNNAEPLIEMERLYPDIDLSPFIPDIAQEMNVRDIRSLVRKLDVSSNCIEEITYNNPQDAAEQKIKLLGAWYQNHGRRGAYRTLMTTMRSSGFRATAEKLQGIIEAGRR
ncbi:tumor necrosis factor receptor superfamily member 6 [Elgaria multicarinata webbii]|uniref:tumor necrosis factor receptor superfamily member 6 n=1 Tax=Elgaria multicarinata webbii TaxID=159646 RepID=UPI002FCD5D79